MAHFAELDENNIVQRVVVVADFDTADEDGVEDEAIGIAFLDTLLPGSGTWIQTSYNDRIRGHFAGMGWTYWPEKDIFYLEPAPYPSWVVNESSGEWEPPASAGPCPSGHYWDEDTVSWAPIESPFPSWIWVEPNWRPPSDPPDYDNHYEWDEDTLSWVDVE